MRGSIVIAGILAIGSAAWIASGQFAGRDRASAGEPQSAGQAASTETTVSVRVRTMQPRTRTREIAINGRTEESRRVVVRAETVGPIAEVPVEEGRPLNEGDVIARQNVEDRRALLAEARALEKQRQVEYRAASELAKKGFRSGTKLAEAQALLEAAQARTKSVEIDLSRTTLRAPFGGILETRKVEKGDFVQKGDEIASIVDLDPLLAVGYVSERDIGEIATGAGGTVTLMDGRRLAGKVRFVGAVADPATRSFRVELEIPNPGVPVRAGLTGELRLPLSQISAFVVSPAWLTLADNGEIGVRIVNAADTVEFVPVKILADTAEGLWVSGIPAGARLITVGHEFVKAGQKVLAVPETAETAS